MRTGLDMCGMRVTPGVGLAFLVVHISTRMQANRLLRDSVYNRIDVFQDLKKHRC